MSLVFGYSQSKYERELKMAIEDVPQNAVSVVDSFNFAGKIKWIKEIRLNDVSIEAKTKCGRRNFSIEFSEDGTLEDVEVEMKFREIPKNIRNSIKHALREAFDNYDIRRVQKQFVGHYKDIINLLLAEEKTGFPVTESYELSITVKGKKGYLLYECLFDDRGALQSKVHVVESNQDYLEY